MTDAGSRRVARQLLETDMLLGLDQVVRGSMSSGSVDPEIEPDFKPESEAHASSTDVPVVEPVHAAPPLVEPKPSAGRSSGGAGNGASASELMNDRGHEAGHSELALPFPIAQLDDVDHEQRLESLAARHASECQHCTKAGGTPTWCSVKVQRRLI